jgi:hypothetical protein
MLDRTTTTYSMPPTASIETITGQAIAKTRRWSQRARANFAARWKLGLINVAPSTKLAAETFGVSVRLVMEEIAYLEAHPPKSNGTGSERDKLDAFVRENLLEVWAAIERVTAQPTNEARNVAALATSVGGADADERKTWVKEESGDTSAKEIDA